MKNVDDLTGEKAWRPLGRAKHMTEEVRRETTDVECTVRGSRLGVSVHNRYSLLRSTITYYIVRVRNL